MKNFLLRKAKPADAVKITEIYLASRKAFISFAPLVNTDDSIYQWIVEELIPTNQVFVAEEGGSIVAMMALTKNAQMSWITQLYVSPSCVGYGVGSLLLAKAKSVLGPPIRLYTFEANTAARRFYERNGFKILAFVDGAQNEENCPAILYEWRPDSI